MNQRHLNRKTTLQTDIPNKLFFRISEVCKIVGVEAYVLRFWESEFPTLNPAKGTNGRRTIRKRDIEIVLTIKRLLYEEGYTIAGARNFLSKKHITQLSITSPDSYKKLPEENRTKESSASTEVVKTVRSIKSELHSILTMLNRRW